MLVQVPRRGYLPSLSCQDCRRPARCTVCAGPLGAARPAGPAGLPLVRPGRDRLQPARPAAAHRLRSSVVGARRTAEELGRAFPGVPVERSGRRHGARHASPPGRAWSSSTPGAEPVAHGGYAAALLLDAWALLDRPDLRAGEEALRRWLAAAALVRPASEGGRVVLAGAPTEVSIPAVEALVRWDPAWFAERELDERRELSLPPAARLAVLTGARPALEAATAELELPPHGLRARAAAARGHRPLAHPGHRRPGPTARPWPASSPRCGPGPRPARTPTRSRCGSTRPTPTS